MVGIFLLCLVSSFVEKWDIPKGTNYTGGRLAIGDTDRDSCIELLFNTYGDIPAYVYIYEYHSPNTWLGDSIPLPGGDLLWSIGDFDSDGYHDLAIQFHIENPTLADGLSIYESPDSFSYPTTEVWRDTVGPPLALPISVYDIDQDGLTEIVKNRATPYGYIGIYESIGDNQYDLIFADDPDTTGNEAPAATHACGDFDLDDRIECVFAGGDEWYWVYESPSDNTYEKVNEGTVATLNVRDCFSVADADQDGKWEFVVKGFVIPTGEIHAFIFEAIGDNTYEVTQTFTLPGGDYYGGYSEAGDVDGDSISEIVLEAQYNVFIIKAAGNNAFYVWDTLPGHGSGSCVRVYDIDNNGLAEIIISGEDETRIYEYDVGVEEHCAHSVEHMTIRISPNPFSKLTNISFGNVQGAKGVELKIHDATGRLVKSFSLPTAYSLLPTVLWDGTDDAGHPLSSGVYFVHFETRYNTINEKVILLR
jgi:hypothetical protein